MASTNCVWLSKGQKPVVLLLQSLFSDNSFSPEFASEMQPLMCFVSAGRGGGKGYWTVEASLNAHVLQRLICVLTEFSTPFPLIWNCHAFWLKRRGLSLPSHSTLSPKPGP